MKIAVLGVGHMGAALAEHALSSGLDVVVYNRTAAKTVPLVALGAQVATTAADAIRQADVSIFLFSDGAVVERLLADEQVRHAVAGARILNASTTTPREIDGIAKEVKFLGGDLAEMTIMSGPEQLRTGTADFLIGCADDGEGFWTGLVAALGASAHRVGAVGDATSVEQPMLLASVFTSVLTAYAAAMAIKQGVAREVIEPYITAAIPSSEYLLPNMFSRTFDTDIAATVNSFAATARTAVLTAEDLGVPTAALTGLLSVFETAVEQGRGDLDGASIVEVLLAEPGRQA